ncbi:unnamed protein product [Gordionus sp. m RMFG-2023]|uniref:uncharacterized protein LOC135929864 n=1 Tax=Gordionus sp. m RMFG-2023 TaxID=3053472 RepID=UPI0030E1DE2E
MLFESSRINKIKSSRARNSRAIVLLSFIILYDSLGSLASSLSCYICTDNRPQSKCQLDPENVDVGPKKLMCNRTYCYTQWDIIEGEITFVSRGCENKSFGNKCVKAHDGRQLVCYQTCATELCNNMINVDPKNFTTYDANQIVIYVPPGATNSTASRAKNNRTGIINKVDNNDSAAELENDDSGGSQIFAIELVYTIYAAILGYHLTLIL